MTGKFGIDRHLVRNLDSDHNQLPPGMGATRATPTTPTTPASWSNCTSHSGKRAANLHHALTDTSHSRPAARCPLSAVPLLRTAHLLARAPRLSRNPTSAGPPIASEAGLF